MLDGHQLCFVLDSIGYEAMTAWEGKRAEGAHGNKGGVQGGWASGAFVRARTRTKVGQEDAKREDEKYVAET